MPDDKPRIVMKAENAEQPRVICRSDNAKQAPPPPPPPPEPASTRLPEVTALVPPAAKVIPMSEVGHWPEPPEKK